MTAYIIRRVLYSIPILIGVNVLIFALFFVVNSPDDMARTILGDKNVTPEAITNWKQENGYHLPLFWNTSAAGAARLTETIFFTKSVRLFVFDFGNSDRTGISIGDQIRLRMAPSLAIAVPTFVLGLLVNITLSLIVAFYRATYLDRWALVLCVVTMSISALFYIIGGQYVFAISLRLVPISGFDTGVHMLKFVLLPVAIGVVAGVGAGVRFYRIIFLEVLGNDYIRTARAKGLSEVRVLFKHVLKNAMIPILTGVVMTIPFLFYGSLLMEAFFAIPGLGGYTLEAINGQDFAVVRAMVYLGAVLNVAGLVLTDISYTLVDPRVRLG
ncbi:MAG: ABC transporter permease [Deltaproteobacteria bacterium]|nr:ABC transporter permease [Deltaproteobacteria bacterium]